MWPNYIFTGAFRGIAVSPLDRRLALGSLFGSTKTQTHAASPN